MSVAPHSAPSLRRPHVRRLTLRDFRSYETAELRVEASLVALCGENGAGKTNLLEALSLFAPGRGLQRAEFGDCARQAGAGGFAAAIELTDDCFGDSRMGVGLGADGKRLFRLDGGPAGSTRDFVDRLRLIWLTPAMDRLFAGPPGDRRRYLDRIVLSVDPGHGARASAYERALRNRNRLLEMGAERAWLEATEREIAELGVAVTAARLETLGRLQALIAAERDDASPFPSAEIALDGGIEQIVAGAPALAAEDRFRALLADNRARDAAAGRALQGPQSSDLAVRHAPKAMEARLCSTGEQKALLTGLTLAHARLVASMSGMTPLVLLDEAGAHLDPRRRAALFDALERLGAQAWLTGADPQAFDGLEARAQQIDVVQPPGQPSRLHPVTR